MPVCQLFWRNGHQSSYQSWSRSLDRRAYGVISNESELVRVARQSWLKVLHRCSLPSWSTNTPNVDQSHPTSIAHCITLSTPTVKNEEETGAPDERCVALKTFPSRKLTAFHKNLGVKMNRRSGVILSDNLYMTIKW